MKARMKSSFVLKREAKAAMGRTAMLWFRLLAIYVGIQLLLGFLMNAFGLGVSYYLLPIADYPDIQTGQSLTVGGFEMFMRMDELGYIMAFGLEYSQIIVLVLQNLLTVILLAPLHLAIMERFWLGFREITPEDGAGLRFYRSPSLFWKAVAVDVLYVFVPRLVGLLCFLPSAYLAFLLMDPGYIDSSGMTLSEWGLLNLLSLVLSAAGTILTFVLSTFFVLPLYCFAARPDYSLREMLRRGFESVRGYRFSFLLLQLSFLPWLVLNAFSYGVLQLYLLPYLSYTAFGFLQEAAVLKKDRQP